MHGPRLAALSLVLLSALIVPPVKAQDPLGAVYSFALFPEDESRVDVPVNGEARLTLIFRDESRDGAGALLPDPVPPTQTTLQTHPVRFRIEPLVDDPGWFVKQPVGFPSYSGTEERVEVLVQNYAQARTSIFVFNVTALVGTPQNGTHEVSTQLLAYSLGASSFAAQVPKSYILQPKEIANVGVRVSNFGIQPRSFGMRVLDNPCDMLVATSDGTIVPGKGMTSTNITVQTPGEKLWYFSELCTISLEVYPTGNEDVVQTAFVSIQVNGGYVNPMWVFWTVFWLLLIFLLFFLLRRRKERIEEELLGKPQKPWTIPVEALYLRALRQKDERAWYVVRHHLMEEEYRSSLLWYAAYKKATKGSRKKETLVLRQEKKYEKWKAAWEKAIAKPLKEADRFEAKLQRKLDRKARKDDRKDARKVRKVTKRMAAAHAKQVERALEKWQKQAKKAARKGLAAPERPVLPEPDYPEEPEARSYALAEHKWSKKAARFRARRVREQGNLEVKFEKADARRLAKLRRKVQRLARRLDDPDFVAEHPLLRAEA